MHIETVLQVLIITAATNKIRHLYFDFDSTLKKIVLSALYIYKAVTRNISFDNLYASNLMRFFLPKVMEYLNMLLHFISS